MKLANTQLKKTVLLNILSAALVLSTPIAKAQQFTEFEVPQGCEFGRDSDSDVPLTELATAVVSGASAITNPTPDTIVKAVESAIDLINSAFESWDYLRIQTPQYVLQNETFQAKGNLFDQFAYVRFHNSELGYVGKDKSSIEANSYFNMKFPKTYGAGLVWITRADNSRCSLDSVYVQKRPIINSAAVTPTSNPKGWRIDTNYIIDQYSKAAQEPSQKVKFTLNGYNTEHGGSLRETYLSSQLNGNNSFYVYPSGGLYELELTISDGTYSTTIDLGTQWSSAPIVRPCDNCNLF